MYAVVTVQIPMTPDGVNTAQHFLVMQLMLHI